MIGQQYSGGDARPPVVINDVPLTPLELNGERVLTLAMIDKVHGRPDGTAGRNFRENRPRMTEGKHYTELTADEIRRQSLGHVFPPRTPKGILVTERGYLMVVKSLNDDLAWKVQDALVESYFKVKEQIVIPMRGPRTAVSREHRLTMRDQVMYAKMAGLTGNQMLLAANRAAKMLTGIDNLGLLGVQHMAAPQNEALLTPSDIATRSGMRSGSAVNKRFCEIGLQTQHRDHRGHPYYEPTELGISIGATMQDTGKKRGDGTPVRQLRWTASAIRFLEDANGSSH